MSVCACCRTTTRTAGQKRPENAIAQKDEGGKRKSGGRSTLPIRLYASDKNMTKERRRTENHTQQSPSWIGAPIRERSHVRVRRKKEKKKTKKQKANEGGESRLCFVFPWRPLSLSLSLSLLTPKGAGQLRSVSRNHWPPSYAVPFSCHSWYSQRPWRSSLPRRTTKLARTSWPLSSTAMDTSSPSWKRRMSSAEPLFSLSSEPEGAGAGAVAVSRRCIAAPFRLRLPRACEPSALRCGCRPMGMVVLRLEARRGAIPCWVGGRAGEAASVEGAVRCSFFFFFFSFCAPLSFPRHISLLTQKRRMGECSAYEKIKKKKKGLIRMRASWCSL
ncbi:hypothetical protein B0J12DRAFT_230394 [Macrophomina phaseolina]|uniref:Uncharacterized protein n=1 Tax=Macrophomina phaseolina TaxID=35725 RepID=A0ABQ8GPX8_9PEZI|nr:hypothetical protein B0J12DRAFT_230394 [Macrophomina phaseolina]